VGQPGSDVSQFSQKKNEEKTAALHPLDSQVAQSHSTQNAETQTAIVSRIFSVFFPVRYTKRKLF